MNDRAIAGEFVTETFDYDGGRQVTVYVPPDPPEAVVFAGDGAIFCASPGAGYKPTEVMPSRIPRTYLVAGTQEPFFLENATRWAAALRDAGADVVMKERVGSHGGAFWRKELPLMVAWAFRRE
jgi:hypothetical protein